MAKLYFRELHNWTLDECKRIFKNLNYKSRGSWSSKELGDILNSDDYNELCQTIAILVC